MCKITDVHKPENIFLDIQCSAVLFIKVNCCQKILCTDLANFVSFCCKSCFGKLKILKLITTIHSHGKVIILSKFDFECESFIYCSKGVIFPTWTYTFYLLRFNKLNLMCKIIVYTWIIRRMYKFMDILLLYVLSKLFTELKLISMCHISDI